MIFDAGHHIVFVILVFLCSIPKKGHAATPAEWRGQSIYQVFTDRFARTDGSVKAACAPGYEGYCGGTWKGIISKLDYIKGMGFTAIWISPVVEQVSDASRAYHGYSASNIYALNENFGSASDLKALAKALHKKGMYLMVDVVANHMAYDGTAETVDYSTLTPFDDKSYFHNICWINDYDDQTDVEQCWLGGDDYPLPDLNTTLTTVRDMFSSWVGDFVSNYSIDGLRVDTVKNVEQPFWPIFNSASGVYNVGELSNGNVDYFCPYQDYMDGLLDYPTYYQATLFFSNTSANSTNFLNEIQDLNFKCKDQTLLGSFSENHDQPRFASITSDMSLAKNIITYTMLGDGIPIIYQGQEQHLNGTTDPYNREALWLTHYTKSTLYKHTKTLNKIRSQAISKSSTYLTWNTQVVYNDTNTVAFRKGDESYMTLMIVNNLGENASKYTVSMSDVGFPAGLKVVDMLNCGKSLTVDGDGGLEVEVKGGLPSVYYPLYLLKGSNLCSGAPLFAAPVRLSIVVAVLTCVFLGLSSVF